MRRLIACVLLSGAASWTSLAHAAICSLTGTVRIESLDSYYCDSNHLTYCASWLERDLDSNARPMKFMSVAVYSTSLALLGFATTNASGQYTATWTQPSCTGNVLFAPSFTRIHESDVSSSDPRIRFQVVDDTELPYFFAWPAALTSSTSTFNLTFARTSGVPTETARIANVYYTANSAISEMILWRQKINDEFSARGAGVFKVVYDVNGMQGNGNPGWTVTVAAGAYNQGMAVRHELGHKVYDVLTDRARKQNCLTGRFGNTPDNHGFMSCEWGSVAYDEGMASFLGVRSITTADTGVWHCGANNNGNQDSCSEVADIDDNIFTFADTDRIVGFAGGGFMVGVGDAFASSRTNCPLAARNDGCFICSGGTCTDCPDTNGDGLCDNHQALGFRLEPNIVRFLWDIVDTSNDGETTDESMVSLATLIDGIPCVADSGFNVDGNCNEPNRDNDSSCSPVSEIGPPPPITTMRGTRDSHNVWDLGDIVPGSQADARSLNCVEVASD